MILQNGYCVHMSVVVAALSCKCCRLAKKFSANIPTRNASAHTDTILCLKLLFHRQFLLESYVARALNEREVIFTPLPPWPQLSFY